MADNDNDRDNQEELEERTPQRSSYFGIDLGSDSYFDAAATDAEQEEAPRAGRPNRFQQGIDSASGQLKDYAKDRLKDEATKRIKKQVAKKLGQQVAKQIVQKGAAAAAAAGAEVILPAVGVIAAVVGGIALILILVVAVMGLSGGDAAASGTSETVPFSVTSTVDISGLKTTIAGGVDSAAKASAVLTEVEKLKGQLSGNPSAISILNAIEAAARAIIAAPTDTELIEAKSRVIKVKTEELAAVIGATGDCNGATACLNVPGVKQLSGGHCGTASMIMVLLYLTNGANGSSFYDREGNQTVAHRGGACPMANTLESNAPANKKGWTRVNWAEGVTPVNGIGKDAVIEAVKRSLAGGDPVIAFFDPGGIYSGQHIVVIVGYDQESDTFYINDPFPGGFRVKVNTAGRGIGGSKLTSDYVKQHLGGDGSPYPVSVHIRRQYVQ